jgi:hypothetical protein
LPLIFVTSPCQLLQLFCITEENQTGKSPMSEPPGKHSSNLPPSNPQDPLESNDSSPSK